MPLDAHPLAAPFFFEQRYNENHDPDTGQFSSGDGSSSADVTPTENSGKAPISAPNASKPKSDAAHAPPTGYEFVSPSVASHLDFGQAVEAVSSDQQRELREASVYINGALHIDAREYDIVGAWADGAENSVMDVVSDSNWDRLKLAASMKGWLADQKQVLIFQESPGGDAAMAHFEATGKLEDIHKTLLQDGVAFHTLVPHEGGATVYVADLDGSAKEAIKKAAARYDAEVGIKWGRAEFLGTQKQDGTDREQRDDARNLYEGNIRQSKVAGHNQVWQRVRDRWGQGIHQAEVDGGSRAADFISGRAFDPIIAYTDALFERYNENHDPDTGEFTSGDGGGSGGSAAPTEAVDHSPKAEPVLNAKAVDVGGDGWNKDTARRLETDYQNAKPALDEIVRNGIGDDVEGHEEHDDDEFSPGVPEEWDMLSGDQQEQAKDAYVKQNLDGYIENEQNYYFESGNALDDAKRQVVDNFNDGSEEEWFQDALDDWVEAREENGKEVPFSTADIAKAITLEYADGHEGSGNFDVNFDDKQLQHPKNEIPGQMDLPGMGAPPPPHEQLTEDMRDEITKLIEKAFDERADDVKDKLDAPDYINDSAQEQVEQDWEHNLDYDDKFKWTKNNTDIIADAEKEAEAWHEDHGGTSGEVPDPDKFTVDPLQENGSNADYKATQRLAAYLSIERQKQIIEQRDITVPGKMDQSGTVKYNDVAESDISRIDRQLWTEWKNSSTSFGGQILQLATADELGGRYRDLPTHKSDLIAQANDKYKAIGGFDGVKALVRAKWETTQYLLDKADVHNVEVYRGMKVNLPKDEKIERVSVFSRIADTKLIRNGAWSTTTDRTVANQWSGGAGDKIVLRIDAPRTAVLSVPAYGINVHSEKELVLAGTAYKNWDAWKGSAPSFAEVPIGTPATPQPEKVAA